MADTRKKFVVAGSFQQYRQWLMDNGLSQVEARYVNHWYELLGLANAHVYLVGTYARRNDFTDISANLERWEKTCGFEVHREEA